MLREELVPPRRELLVAGFFALGGAPGSPAVPHGEEDDGAGPDVEGAGVVVSILGEDFRRDVGQTATDTWGAATTFFHFLATLAAALAHARVQTAEDFADAEIGDFDVPFVVHEEILQLDVAVRDAVFVEVRDALEELLEEAEVVFALQVFLLDEGEHVAVLAVLHDVVPAAGVGA